MRKTPVFGLIVIALLLQPLAAPRAQNDSSGRPVTASGPDSNTTSESESYFSVSVARLEWDSFAFNFVLDSIEKIAGPYGLTTDRVPLSSRGLQLVYGKKPGRGTTYRSWRARYIEATAPDPLFYYREDLHLSEIPYYVPRIPGIPIPAGSTLQGVNAGGLVFLSGQAGLLRRYDLLLKNGWLPFGDSEFSPLRQFALELNLELLRDTARQGGQALANFHLASTNPIFKFDYAGALDAHSTTVADWGRLRPGFVFEIRPGESQAFFILGDLIYGRGRAVNEIQLNSLGGIAYDTLELQLPLSLGMRSRLTVEQKGYGASAGYRFDFGGAGLRIWYEYESLRIRILDLKSELQTPALVFTVLGNPFLMFENALLEILQKSEDYREWQRGIHIALTLPL